MDKILICGLRARCVIGVYSWEREQPQDVLLSIILSTNTKRAGQTDQIEDSIDYQKLSDRVLASTEKSNRYTIEALAEDIASLCLEEPKVEKVLVRVEKNGSLCHANSVSVEIERFR